jgi:hypothetical protein
MRWGVLALALWSSGGCGQPVDETHSLPFLALRHSQIVPPGEPSPDGGPIQPVPIGAPGDPGSPIE